MQEQRFTERDWTLFINNIISLINEGAISFENFEEFSDGLKETVSFFIERK